MAGKRAEKTQEEEFLLMPEIEKQFCRITYLLDDNIKMEKKYRMRVCELNSTELGQGLKERSCEHGNEPSGSITVESYCQVL